MYDMSEKFASLWTFSAS